MRKRINTPGRSYVNRVSDIIKIYDEHARDGLSNREILRRFIYPKYFICERTFYNIVNASANNRVIDGINDIKNQLSLFND